ncbi:sensor histidine kinase [Mucilaginibacter arboris]|uniref:Histidine kinase n=1 Tax=Mucilaginibacter arboris TaxID=2682090 RepID=A0A7K1SSM6_9SPHI|nr:histidine kinase [Mucilaginibacter arboris]MVN20318.1 histidine kinase [Mucilaginibacter arboris]
MALKRFYSGKIQHPAIHIFFWVLVIISPYLFRNPNTYQGISPWQYKLIINNILLATCFYFNAYLLYPQLYKQKKLFLYVLSLVFTVAVVMYFSRLIDQLLFPFTRAGFHHFGKENSHNLPGGRFHFRPEHSGFDRGWFGWYFTNMITYLFIMGISFSYRIIIDNAKQEKTRKEKENENLKTELSFLRSQVSPHFMFNTLNTLVLFARKKSDMLEPSLIELSKLMRYMLYENDEERVLLSREVEYLKSYISLQMLRFEDDLRLNFDTPDRLDTYYIEPMLLTPFVENAFKHGVGMVKGPQIKITLSVNEITGWLSFEVINTIAPPQDTKDSSSGIGLTNVRRRLDLLYPNNYNLSISEKDEMHIARLKLKLK